MNDIDKAFYDLVVQERDLARHRLQRIEEIAKDKGANNAAKLVAIRTLCELPR